MGEINKTINGYKTNEKKLKINGFRSYFGVIS